MTQPLSIAVIGAGIGGLAVASLLAADHRVTLIERFDTPRPLGSGLVVQPVGLAVLAAIGCGDQARALGTPIRRMLGHAGKRTVLDVAYRDTAPGLAMHRAALFHVLWQAMLARQPRLITGAQVTGCHQTASGAEVMLADGRQLGPFDLVVDASGAGSALSGLRARVLPFGAVWAQVPWPATSALPRDQLTQRYAAARRMAGILPIGQLPGDPTPRAAVFWSLSRKALADWPTRDLAPWKAEVAAFWPQMAPFLDGLQDKAQLTPAQYGHGTLAQVWIGRLVRIGDAAHRASPQLGQGANMALLDALSLSHALREPLDRAMALHRASRRWHVALYQAMSAAFTPMYQSDSALLPALRDHLLAPLSQVWPMPRILSALVTGDLIPPLAGTRFPDPGWTAPFIGLASDRQTGDAS